MRWKDLRRSSNVRDLRGAGGVGRAGPRLGIPLRFGSGGSILTVVFGVIGTLVIGTYYLPEHLKDAGVLEISQVGWALFLVANVLFTYLSR